jgi:hypothetical protein
VPAALGVLLIFQVKSGHARRLELPDRPHDVERLAEAGVRVDDDGDRHRFRRVAGVPDDLFQGHQPDVRIAGDPVGGPGTRDIDSRKARPLGQQRDRGVEDARHRVRALPEQPAERLPLISR